MLYLYFKQHDKARINKELSSIDTAKVSRELKYLIVGILEYCLKYPKFLLKNVLY